MNADQPTKIGTIADLARVAGVSISTVSRALSGKGLLKSETRDRIREIAERHGFQTDSKAQNLRLGRSGTIGIVLPLGHEKEQHVSDPFFMAILALLADNISARGHDLLFRRVEPQGDDWLTRIADPRRVDGILVIGQSDQAAAIDRFGQGYAPMVVWGEWSAGQSYCTVGVDNVVGGRLAAEHLLERGRRKLAFFGNVGLPEFRARHDGFLEMLPPDLYDHHRLVPIHMTAQGSHAAAIEYLRACPDTDGIFAASDVIAMSVIRAAADIGKRVPHDLSVVGFDDVPMAAQGNPPLTTIRQDLERGARLMCTMLFDILDGKGRTSEQLVPELIVRASS